MKLYRKLDLTKEYAREGDEQLKDNGWVRPMEEDGVTQQKKEELIIREALDGIHEIASAIRVLASAIKNRP